MFTMFVAEIIINVVEPTSNLQFCSVKLPSEPPIVDGLSIFPPQKKETNEQNPC